MKRCRRIFRTGSAAIASACVMFAASGATADAAFEFESVGTSLTSGGVPTRLGGAHPDLTFKFSLPTKVAEPGGSGHENPLESARDVELRLPPGVVGNAADIPTCSPAQLQTNGAENGSDCPVSAQIGTLRIRIVGDTQQLVYTPLYNLSHGPEVPARFGFYYLGAVATISASVRPSDYGVTSGSFDISQILPIAAVELKVWGVPADPSHDAERAQRGSPTIEGATTEAPVVPFLRTATSCPQPGSPFVAAGDSWQSPGQFDVRTLSEDEEGAPLFFEGCEDLGFAPKFSAQPTSAAADSPAGMAIDLVVPQSETPTGLSTADVRRVVATFPQGMAVSPPSASGLGACAESQVGIGTASVPSCPDSSKLGTVQIRTPLLEEELEGGLYLARQRENPFGSLLALYLIAKGPGFYLKLPGEIAADPNTGRLTVTFDETPQLPFEELTMNLKSGPRAPLSMPRTCGTYAVKTEITPWSGTPPVLGESKFTVDQNCASGGFKPTLRAGTTNPNGGSFSPFNLQVVRQDGESNISSIKAILPEGLLAKLAGVPLCPEAGAATSACPASSQVGTATIGAGSGSNPLYIPEAGKAPTAVYLAGPYKGAPYSLVVKVPAQAGPFDLGTVVVRNALNIDPVTTQVTSISDPLPQILEGIPVAYRDVRVEINRPNFIVNPTGCMSKKVSATITGAGGAIATPSAPFAATNCDALGLAPKLVIRFSGAPTRRGGHPKLTATLTTGKNESNLKQVQVTLPKTEFLENAHIQTVCTRVQYAADNCPAKSVYGHAKAWTPLLDKPLEGPVYLRSSNHKLPDLVASLDGQIHVELAGRIDSVKARIRNSFETVPDAPVSKFVLTMNGGGKGLLVNNTQLCREKPRANVVFDGQNGKTAKTAPLVSVAGCGRGGGKKK